MDLERMGEREARVRVAAEEEEAPPVVNLRSEKAGLAATDAMWGVGRRGRGSGEIEKERRECD